MELKPCPFCGGKAELVYIDRHYRECFVKCLKCKVEQGHVYRSKQSAITAWNRRRDMNELGSDNVIWCEDCKFFGDSDMGGEGWCETYDTATWYGKNAIDCPYFKPRKAEEGET